MVSVPYFQGVYETTCPSAAYALVHHKETEAVVMPSYSNDFSIRAEKFARSFCNVKPFYHRLIHSRANILIAMGSFLERIGDDTGISCEGRFEFLNLLDEKVRLFGYLSGATSIHCAIRNHFWPMDCIWHLDPSFQSKSDTKTLPIRMVWAIGRNCGTIYCPASNVRRDEYASVLEEGKKFLENIRAIGTHDIARAISETLKAKEFTSLIAEQDRLFLHHPDLSYKSASHCVTIHRVGNPFYKNVTDPIGTFHRGSMENRDSPGLQIIFSAVS